MMTEEEKQDLQTFYPLAISLPRILFKTDPSKIKLFRDETRILISELLAELLKIFDAEIKEEYLDDWERILEKIKEDLSK